MSRVGKLPVAIPAEVKVTLDKNLVTVAGKRGTLSVPFTDAVNVAFEDNKITVSPKAEDNRSRAMWGLYRNLINNSVKGVSTGFSMRLEINGVGYRAALQGKILTLNLGYSHDINSERHRSGL